MLVLIASLLQSAVPHAAPRAARGRRAGDDRAAFVTTLGRDTVALETVVRVGDQVDGDVVVRVPSTVRIHYRLALRPDGSVARSALDLEPMGARGTAPRHVVLDFEPDAVRISTDSAGQHREVRTRVQRGTVPVFMTGFGPAFGLYSAMGLYELLLERARPRTNDTLTVPAIDLASGTITRRRFIGRSATRVDVDYFNVLWTHLTVDSGGRVLGADARETTEQTETRRTEFFDVAASAKAFAARDRAGTGVGAASPNQIGRATLGGTAVVVTYGSPRKRGRTILGGVVPYDRVWRTGANEATLLLCDRDFTLGGVALPAGAYSLWTMPRRDGSVDLIVNRQHGQWGTDYDPSQNVARVAAHVAPVAAPREDLAIAVSGTGNAGELRIAWDTFVWTAPISVSGSVK